MHLASAANVDTPAYLTLLSKGYALKLQGSLWIAEKGEDSFIGDNPIELLGLISLAEVRGENWRASDEEIQQFMDKFP